MPCSGGRFYGTNDTIKGSPLNCGQLRTVTSFQDNKVLVVYITWKKGTDTQNHSTCTSGGIVLHKRTISRQSPESNPEPCSKGNKVDTGTSGRMKQYNGNLKIKQLNLCFTAPKATAAVK